MGTKCEVINLTERKRQIQQAKDGALEQQRFEYAQQCEAMFIYQHSDDDTFENAGEFEFKKDS